MKVYRPHRILKLAAFTMPIMLLAIVAGAAFAIALEGGWGWLKDVFAAPDDLAKLVGGIFITFLPTAQSMSAKYIFGAEDLRVRKDFIGSKLEVIRWNAVERIEVTDTILSRHLGMCTVRLYWVGGVKNDRDDPSSWSPVKETVLRGVPVAAAQQVRRKMGQVAKDSE